MDTYKNDLSTLLSKVSTLGNKVCNEQNVSQIEVDVLKDKLRAAYDLLLDFPVSQPQAEVPKEEQKQEEVRKVILKIEREEPTEQEKEPLQCSKKKTFALEETLDYEEQREEDDDVEQEEIDNIVENTPSVLKYLHENIINDATKEKQLQPPLDLFTDKHTSIADKFENRQTINDRVNEAMVGDLRTNIGVNEKFLFINDLFFGNMKGYTDFIQELNSSESWEQATTIIDNYQQEKQWKDASLAFSTLITIIEKRFKHNHIIG
ncbi:MAG: hypothetical protein LBO06_02020 [Bacteroidales bacterium]|nr:hypothetical protein [Bacteroidales bacterium]